MTRCLLIHAHPLPGSLNAHLAATVETLARAQGWQVTRRDLYDGFDPVLTAEERAGYYATPPVTLTDEKRELAEAQVLILVFPTWWSGFPAILKGWFDRVWTPAVAFDPAPDLGAMRPRLSNLQQVLAVTTMGAPRWIDWLVLRQPLRRALCRGIIRPCAPRARVRWLALYQAETVPAKRVQRFEARIAGEIKAMTRRLRCPD
ncbi:NAD(P)H-dependent oxidoreductase [Rhodobacter calidifons]|uniref:NAD(P)H-dependent oxidoreductase n=1 Tax=Rhodobacter calidifons TaxID=2715277 RepID=A0ABX0G8R8_9RHOB|nr:NAD(P)H-dependent oxidoreductase [Rhodobacter calidifons]NHB77678.1 NAD(P)H-dependent oxidoreductase [Rhodobacter calidifons]